MQGNSVWAEMERGGRLFGPIRAVLFDLFDTLLLIRRSCEDPGERCMRNVYRFLVECGVNVSFEDFRKAYFEVHKQIYERINRYLEEPHFSVRILQTLLKLGYNHDAAIPMARGAAEAYIEELSRHVYLDAEAIPVLTHLRSRGYKTGVISNFSIPEGARKLIAAHGLMHLLDIIVISGEINRRKPSPEIFVTALDYLNVKPSEAIFVGDTPDMDIKGAKMAGLKAILINRGNIKASSIEDKPDLIIGSLREILSLL